MQLTNPAYLTYTIALTLLIQLAAADFSIYRLDPPGPESNGPWKLFNNDATCGELQDRIAWSDRRDVSGKRLGLRCKGTACDYHVIGNPRDWEELEMHFINHPLRHFTIYWYQTYTGDDGDAWYDMLGVDGKKYGACKRDEGHEIKCKYEQGVQFGAQKKFRCETEVDATTLTNIFKKGG